MASRACGDRVAGGIYASVGLGAWGHPIECFIIDRPVAIPWREMGISELGVSVIDDPRTGISHIYDIVGRNYYPDVADFIEEARVLGVSRRLPPHLPWHKITRESRLILLHSRAVIGNEDDYATVEPRRGERPCPNAVSIDHCGRTTIQVHEGRPSLNSYPPACARFWWQDLTAENLRNQTGERVSRQVCETVRYEARERSIGVRAQYSTGIILKLPLSAIEIIRDNEQASHRKYLDSVQLSQIPVRIMNE